MGTDWGAWRELCMLLEKSKKAVPLAGIPLHLHHLLGGDPDSAELRASLDLIRETLFGWELQRGWEGKLIRAQAAAGVVRLRVCGYPSDVAALASRLASCGLLVAPEAEKEFEDKSGTGTVWRYLAVKP